MERNFYTSRTRMLIVFIIIFSMLLLQIPSFYTQIIEGMHLGRFFTLLLIYLLFLYISLYALKESIRPSLIVTFTPTGLRIERYRHVGEIRWEEIDFYMIYRKSSTKIYIFLKENSSLGNKKVGFTYEGARNSKRMKEIMDDYPIKEIQADYEIFNQHQNIKGR